MNTQPLTTIRVLKFSFMYLLGDVVSYSYFVYPVVQVIWYFAFITAILISERSRTPSSEIVQRNPHLCCLESYQGNTDGCDHLRIRDNPTVILARFLDVLFFTSS